MKISSQFLFLGTGGSMGVPVIGCKCSVCHSKSSYDKRMRPSGLLTIGVQNILIDCGPDFHQQALLYKIENLDGCLLTHAHYDHIAGVDELRVFYMRSKKALPCLLSKMTGEELQNCYYYMFEREASLHKLVPKFSLQFLEGKRGQVNFLNIPIKYVTYEQADTPVNGYIIGNLAYLTDIHNYPENIFEDLKGVDTLIISALRFTPSHLHLTVDQAIEFAKKVSAKQTWLTHISHDLDHEKTNAYLPSNIRVAYDGLKLDFEV